MIGQTMTSNHASLRRRVVFRTTQFLVACFCVGGELWFARRAERDPYVRGAALADASGLGSRGSIVREAPSYRGALTFATTGNGDPFHPAIVQDRDLGSGDVRVGFGHGAPRRVAEPHAGLATLATLM
jgi:hypothetical protein